MRITTIKLLFVLTVAFIGSTLILQAQEKHHNSFFEDFDSSTSQLFKYGSAGKNADFTWKIGIESPTEPGTNILLFKINPDEEAGAGKGPEIISNNFTHFGSYAARLKVADVRDVQPNVGAVVGYFTYFSDTLAGLSEIDFEWLIADPEIIYIGTWTGFHGKLKRIGRVINMASGTIYETSTKENHTGTSSPLTGVQCQPETIQPIDEFDASSQFHTYGFDWYSDSIRWWMIHPATNDTIVLWNYKGSQMGIPQNSSLYRVNFWHTDNWPVETIPTSIEKPQERFELEVDWMSYDPLKEQ
ncbi:glycoside hydrolase family 16 protein [uncultured Draconibacterium sp.]|uniref:glycoside hydrolase family 16 protein n=1 Tax=uncultured Draconibacterium sp. TaxID=1573823 RepID=UPI0029C7C1A5|nr:glycoside hydrolase family 16 protein [uncultured Draconibacterium sp.]